MGATSPDHEDPQRQWPQRGRATLNDVAAAAGVSRQTVSNVVNGTGRVSQRTKERVTQAVGDLDYRAHGGARSLRSRKTSLLAHPVPYEQLTADNMVTIEWMRSLVTAAGDQNHQVLLTAADGVSAFRSLERAGAVDAFILAGVSRRDARAVYLAERRIPFSCFGRLDRPLPQTWVDVDNRAAVRRIVAHLVANGHRRLGFLGFATGLRWDLAREAGFRAGLADAGLAVPERHILAVPHHAVREAIESILNARRAPTAIVTGSDTLAAAVYSVAAARNLRLGADADLAVTGFDGSALGRALTPSLTTVCLPFDDIAARVVGRAIREIGGTTGMPGEILDAPVLFGDSA
jgi:DNA-binding LacI/PurR family transcriptional regulator